MRPTSLAAALALSVSLTTTGLWAQAAPPSPAATPGTSRIGGTSPGVAPGARTVPTPSDAAAPLPPNNPGATHQQIEGQLVDLYDAAQQSLPAAPGATITNSTGTLRIERGNTPAVPAAIPPGSYASASNGGVSYNPAANPNTSITPHVGDSAGTYNHPGAAGGSSDTSASIAGSGRLDPGDRPSGTATLNTPAPYSNLRAPAPDSVRAQLSAGIPAAIISNGRALVLVADPKQLAQYAGQTVRISGIVTPQNLLLPDRLEVRQSSGNFQQVSLNKPSTTPTPAQGTAQER